MNPPMLGKECDDEISLRWCSFCPARDGRVLAGSEGGKTESIEDQVKMGQWITRISARVPRQGRKRQRTGGDGTEDRSGHLFASCGAPKRRFRCE